LARSVLPVSALAGSPFANYFLPGAILFTIIGLTPLAAALLAWRRHPVAPLLTIAVGAALLIWLSVEIAIIGYSSDPPLQPLYLVLGVAIVLVGVAWMRHGRARRRVRVARCGLRSPAMSAVTYAGPHPASDVDSKVNP
jgi:branched-subunit amino acid ABC-type transport system permease component